MSAFYDYVRKRSDEIPAGYAENGMRVYRYLVRLGVTQMIEAHYPDLPERLGPEAWAALIDAFIHQSAWTSPYYGDLQDEFLAFLARESNAEPR